jgi:hypothetical protein
MISMLLRTVSAALALAVTVAAAPAAELDHRVWLLSGTPTAETLEALRAAGVDALVVPVGEAEIGERGVSFVLRPPASAELLAPWPTSALVWVRGSGKAAGSAEEFWSQVGPAQRLLSGSAPLVLAAAHFWEGLPRFAATVAKVSGRPVELAAPVTELVPQLAGGGWPGVTPVVVAFGNPAALGFPPSTLHDDLQALEALDEFGRPYRAAVVIAARTVPAPGPAGASLAAITRGAVASYRPGEQGDIFVLRQAVDWGGVRLEAGQQIETSVVDTTRYHRDLGLLLRPLRTQLIGWDSVGLPAGEPTVGMSREALLDYLRGGLPQPQPQPRVQAIGETTVLVSIVNPTPHASALASTGNWVELQFAPVEAGDVQFGEFTGAEYGKWVQGAWRRTPPREATAVRFYFTYLPPSSQVSGGLVSFLSRPRALFARWGLRLGDGTELEGTLEPVGVTRP